MNVDLLKEDLSSMHDRFQKWMESSKHDELIAALQRYNVEVDRLSKSFAVDEINNSFKAYGEQLNSTTLELMWYDCDFREQMKTFCNTHPLQLDEFQLRENNTLSYGIWGGGGLLSLILLLCGYKWGALVLLSMAAAGGGIVYSGAKDTIKVRFIKNFEKYAQSVEGRIIDWIKTVEHECLNKFNEFKANNHE